MKSEEREATPRRVQTGRQDRKPGSREGGGPHPVRLRDSAQFKEPLKAIVDSDPQDSLDAPGQKEFSPTKRLFPTKVTGRAADQVETRDRSLAPSRAGLERGPTAP